MLGLNINYHKLPINYHKYYMMNYMENYMAIIC